MTDTFVIPDVHGSAQLVRDLLEQEGIIEQDYAADGRLAVAARVKPRSEVEVVQLGDLANCVGGSVEADCEALELVTDGLIDVMLVGNHEHPYFGGPRFSGFWSDPKVAARLGLIHQQGRLRAAHAAGGVLVTHAGLTSYWLREFGARDFTAAQIAEYTNRTWEDDPRSLIFCAIGWLRGGGEREGGILWADWREPKPKFLRQLVGHSAGDNIRRRSGATCIDLGAGKQTDRIAGAWIRGGVIKVVTYLRPEAKAVA